MSREEFLWRWEQLPDLKFAELIDGVVSLSSPLTDAHSTYEGLIHRWLTAYEDAVPGVAIRANATWLLADSSPQPDLALIRMDGSSQLKGKFREGPPELAVEIVESSWRRDLGPKLELYRRSGVAEYLAVILPRQSVEWRVLENGRYQLLAPEDGFLKSRVFPGLWLDVNALFPPDRQRLLAGVNSGMGS